MAISSGVSAPIARPAGDRTRLEPGEVDRRTREMLLRLQSHRHVVRVTRAGPAVFHLGSGTEPSQFPGADEVGPRTARVVGQPESVRGEDEVVCEDGCVFHETRW